MKTADKYGYSERERIREFLVEHEVVKALYEVARIKLEQKDRRKSLLRLFNAAFFVCMRLADGSGRSPEKALDECPYARGEMGSYTFAFRNNLFALIYSLLHVHRGLLPVRAVDRSFFKVQMELPFDWSDYEAVLRRYGGTLTRPIDFSGRIEEVIYHLRLTTESVEKPDESDPMRLLARATSDIAKAGERMKTQLAEKDKRIKELADQVKEEQAKVQAKETRIKELEEQNASLSSNPFCLVKIKDYAKGLDKEEAKVITHMLLAIALEEQLPKTKQAEVRKAVKEVEAAHKQQPAYVHIAHQEIHNDNKDSQVFNGSITDSKFGK